MQFLGAPACLAIASERRLTSRRPVTRHKPAGRRRSQVLQPFAPAEAGVEVVPEFDVFLVLFPAKKNLFAPHDGGKINQAALQILDENPAALKLDRKSVV